MTQANAHSQAPPKNPTLVWPLFLLLSAPFSAAKVHNYETTRLKATSGAGVGSILCNEATVLNPASIAFFTNSSFYLQRERFAHHFPEDQDQNRDHGRGFEQYYAKHSRSLGVIAADAKGKMRGALGHFDQREGPYKRRQLAFAVASPVTRNSSLGLLYQNTKDETLAGPSLMPGVVRSHQLTLGTTHIVDKTFTIGVIASNLLGGGQGRGIPVTAGGQYIFRGILTFIVDLGASYFGDLSQSGLLRGALQLNFAQNFFLRAGLFKDHALGEKGNGLGLSWVGPRLVLEAAVKKTKKMASAETVAGMPLAMTETSFAISYFF